MIIFGTAYYSGDEVPKPFLKGEYRHEKDVIVYYYNFACIIFFTSCSENPYSFKEPKDDIERIEIVLAENSLEYTIIKTLSETEKNDFLVEFQEIKFHKYLGDPPKLRGYSIKITYKSGVYEMICYYASEYVESGKIQSLWKRCDEKAFNNLIKLLLEEKSLNH